MTGTPTLHTAEATLEAVRTRRHAAYPAYRPSGIEWLGDMPDHWEVKRLKFLSRINPSASEIKGLRDEDEISFVPMEAVGEYGGMRLDGERRLDEVRSGFTYFRDGDVVIAKITPCFENGKGSIAENLTNSVAFGTTELHVVRSGSDLDTTFLFYLTISDAFRRLGASEMYGAGGQKRVPTDYVRDFPVGFPPLEEQRKIARFLDEQTQKIDDLIGAKRDLLALLREKRQAVITHAVTKGLDTAANLKPSGVEWLGDVPEHWKLLRLKHVVNLLPGYAFPSTEFSDDPDDIRLLRGINVGLGEVVWNETVRWDFGDAEQYRKFLLREGDIVFGMDRPWISGGIRVAEVTTDDVPSLLLQRVARLRAKPQFSQRYIKILIESKPFYGYFAPILTGVSVPHISPGQILEFAFPLPPPKEQRAIVSFLDGEMARMDELESVVREAISSLESRRTSIISAAVTGKIDVRGEVL